MTVSEKPVHKDNVPGLRRRLRGGGALEKRACRAGGDQAHECATIHGMTRLTNVRRSMG